MARHRIGVVARLLLHVGTVLLVVYVLLAGTVNQWASILAPAAARLGAHMIGSGTEGRWAQTVYQVTNSMRGVVRTLVPLVHPVLSVAAFIALPSVLIECLLKVHSRRLQQLARAAAQRPALDPGWGDLFTTHPGRFGGAEASLLQFTHPDWIEPQQPLGVLVNGLVLFPLCEILIGWGCPGWDRIDTGGRLHVEAPRLLLLAAPAGYGWRAPSRSTIGRSPISAGNVAASTAGGAGQQGHWLEHWTLGTEGVYAPGEPLPSVRRGSEAQPASMAVCHGRRRRGVSAAVRRGCHTRRPRRAGVLGWSLVGLAEVLWVAFLAAVAHGRVQRQRASAKVID